MIIVVLVGVLVNALKVKNKKKKRKKMLYT